MSDTDKTLKANPSMILMWAKRDKCWQCKHKFEKPVILPIDKEKQRAGILQPNINPEVLWHVQETHGIPAPTTQDWILGSVYGMELNEVGIKGVFHDDL